MTYHEGIQSYFPQANPQHCQVFKISPYATRNLWCETESAVSRKHANMDKLPAWWTLLERKNLLSIFSMNPWCYQGICSYFVCKMLCVGKLWELNFCSQKWKLWSIVSSVCSHQCSCARIIWASCRNPRKLLPLCNLKWSWSAFRIENRTELVLMSIKRTHYWDKCTSTDHTSPSVSFPDKEGWAQLPKSWL